VFYSVFSSVFLLVLIAQTEQLVEDVKVALAFLLVHDARLLQQVVGDAGAGDLALLVELDLGELAEARRVVVAQRARIAEALQHVVGVDQLLFDARLVVGDVHQVVDEPLAADRLAGATLAAHHHRLVALLLRHRAICHLGDREDVRRPGTVLVVHVAAQYRIAVEREFFVGIDCDQDRCSDVGIDNVTKIPRLEVV